MPAVPQVICTFDSFSKWYSSKRVNGTWTPISLLYDSDDPSLPASVAGRPPLTCSSGAITSALSGALGLLARFSGNGVGYLGLGFPATTPELIGSDNSKSVLSGASWNISQGAWLYAGRERAILAVGNLSNYSVVKRPLGGGENWPEQDAAHALPWNSPLAVRWNGVSQYIRTLRINSGFTTFTLRDFDMASDLWGTDYGSLTPASVVDDFGWGNELVELANGDLVAFYARGGYSLYARYFSAGSWGSEILVSSGATFNQTFANCVLDPNGTRIHVLFLSYKGGGFLTPYVNYVSLDSGTVGTPHEFPFNGGISDGVQHPAIVDGAIYFGFDDFDGDNPDGQPGSRVYRGAPLDNPVWAPEYIKKSADFGATFSPTCTYCLFGDATRNISLLPRYVPGFVPGY